MNKRAWRRRARAAEAELTELRLPPALTFDTLTVCFTDKTFTLRGHSFTVDTNCVSFPLTNDQNLLAPAGWYPIHPGGLA